MTVTTPASVRIASVTLAVQDLAGVARYYVERIGATLVTASDDGIALGIGTRARLDLVPATASNMPGSGAGLFHLAIRLPSRRALGRWALGAMAAGNRIDAASDHGVSEAFYLTDPEGNGIEVYADRASDLWPRDANGIAMTTGPMDVDGVLADGLDDGGPALALPADADLGHVHLRVGDLAKAEAFYVETLGLGVTHRRPGATFLSFSGYHHDLAVNTWQSAGAGPRRPGSPGLVAVTFAGDAAAARLADPWGTELVFDRAA